MNKKLRHHYVPSGLSRNFCLDGKRLYYYDLQEKKIEPSSPGDAFRRKKFHSVVKDDGSTDHNVVEDYLMEFEGHGSRNIKKLIYGEHITQEERQWIASLWGLQLLRTPIVRSGIEGLLKAQLDATSRILDAAGKFGPVPEALRKYGNSFTELLENGAIKHEIVLPQVTMQSFVALPQVSHLLDKMNWCVIESHEDNYFLLSDNPCAILDPDFERHHMGIGVGQPNVEVTLPIGKNHCLLAAWKPIPKHFEAGKKDVMNINRRSAIFGERFFAYPVESKRTMNFLLPYADATPEMVAESIPIPQSNGRAGYMTIARQNLFRNPRSKRLYQAIRPLFPGRNL